MTRQGGHSLVYLLLITSLGAAEPAAVARVIPVTVTGKIAAAVVKQGQPIRLSVTIANGLKGPIGYTILSLKPNRWNGETVTLALVDVYRNESGGFLTTNTDLRKWSIVGGWIPGTYKIIVRAEQMTADGNRCILSVHSDPFVFEIR